MRSITSLNSNRVARCLPPSRAGFRQNGLGVSREREIATFYGKLYQILRKEVIQPQVPLRLPCYDLVPIAEFIFGAWLLAVTSATSDTPHFRGLTGGVYKAQEHIHRGMLTRDY